MEMLSTFNCGIGMILSISKSNLTKCKKHLKKLKIPHFELGFIVPRKSNKKIIF
jgi:phosphoribosylaminoimidazole (AIR) synthetase